MLQGYPVGFVNRFRVEVMTRREEKPHEPLTKNTALVAAVIHA